jgi:hypothetical protein
MDPVDPVVAGGDGAGPVDVTGDQGAEDVAHLHLAGLGELGKVEVAGERREVGELAAALGDAGAVVAHPLQLAGHVEEPESLPQQFRRGGVGDGGEGHLAHLHQERVDAGVVADDRGADVHIPVHQPAGGPGHRPVDLVAHGEHQVPDPLQLRLEGDGRRGGS